MIHVRIGLKYVADKIFDIKYKLQFEWPWILLYEIKRKTERHSLN